MRLPASIPILLAVLGCAPGGEPPTAPPAPTPGPDVAAEVAVEPDAGEVAVLPTPDAPENEVSVRPGVNDNYTQGNVKRFVRRFSRDGREVSDHKEDVLAVMRIQPGQAVADIGAGTGLYTRELSAAVGPEGAVYAVDVTEAFLNHVRRIVANEKLTNVTPVLADPKDVKLPAGSVDVALLSNVYHHVEYPITYMVTVHRALRDDGRLYVADFRRHEGMDDAWVLGHVRAGEQTVVAELDRAGFEVFERHEIMKRNYFLELRKKRQ